MPFDLSQGDVRHHRERARPDPAAAPRPHGGDRARRLHRGGEARDRAAPPRSRSSSRENGLTRRATCASSDDGRRADHPRATRARRACGTSSARSDACAARSRAPSPRGSTEPVVVHRREGARAARPGALLLRGRRAHRRARRRRRPRLDAERRRHPLHRGHAHGRQEGAHPHRHARRRDEGVGAGGAQLGALARRRSSASRPTSSRTPTSTSTCPPGAIPKDGPSAGVTMATALDVAADRRARSDPNLAMTGEITLRGKVLPVGGIKEKVLAARRAGIETVILPQRNEKDLEDVPAGVRETLRFHLRRDDGRGRSPSRSAPSRATAGPGSRAADRPPAPPPDQTAARPCPNCGRIRSSAAGSSSTTERVRRPADFRAPRPPRHGGALRAVRGPRARDPARGAGLPRRAGRDGHGGACAWCRASSPRCASRATSSVAATASTT